MQIVYCGCVCPADASDTEGLSLGTADEEVPIDTELSDYVDVEGGRTADYTSATSDVDLLTDGLHSSDLPRVNAVVSRSVHCRC